MDLNSIKHFRYPKFNNHYVEKHLQNIRKQLETYDSDDREFVATEKLHGSNFSIYTDGENIKCARRNDFLAKNENFHGGQLIAEQMKPKVLELHKAIKETETEDFILILFGEVTGERVQLGISYGENAVRLFDICVYKAESVKFLEHADFVSFCKKFEIETVPVIAEGSLDELLGLNPEFDSRVLGTENNTAEGLVLKHVRELEFGHGSDIERLMIKYKCKKFDEIQNAPKVKKNAAVGDEGLQFLACEFEPLITFARLQAVKSKLTQKQAKNRQFMTQEMFDDILQDMNDESKNKLVENESLMAKSTNLVTKFVNEKIGILNFSNEEYKSYNELLEILEDFTMEHFEKIRAETGKNWQVNIGTLKTGILMHLGFLKSKEKKNIERALMPKVMEKAKELAGF